MVEPIIVEKQVLIDIMFTVQTFVDILTAKSLNDKDISKINYCRNLLRQCTEELRNSGF